MAGFLLLKGGEEIQGFSLYSGADWKLDCKIQHRVVEVGVLTVQVIAPFTELLTVVRERLWRTCTSRLQAILQVRRFLLILLPFALSACISIASRGHRLPCQCPPALAKFLSMGQP